MLIAFDGGSAARRGVEMVASSPLLQGIPCHLIMVGKRGNRDGLRQLETARAALAAAGIEATCSQVLGDPEAAIASAIGQHRIDMLLMGAYTHSPWRSLFTGSRTTELLRASRIPTLLLR